MTVEVWQIARYTKLHPPEISSVEFYLLCGWCSYCPAIQIHLCGHSKRSSFIVRDLAVFLSVRMTMTVYSQGSGLFTTIRWKPEENVICRRELLHSSNIWSTIPPIWPSFGMLKILSLTFFCHIECYFSLFIEEKQWDNNLSKNKSSRLQELE